ncbi:MAG: hypothetical protein L3J16_01040 [Anaerolineales bacterium]|nr:hypothetical protein [Anaerolineales bacterium]
MAKEKFIDHRFKADSLLLIYTVNSILDEYAGMGFRLSLRQLYYQLVARDYIENSNASYKRIGSLISNARKAGLVDWEMIEDRNRVTVQNTHWESPAEIVDAAARSFRIDRWEGQTNYVEVMVEKDALSGILEPVCRELDIPFTANKGYSSSSAMYETAQRLIRLSRSHAALHVIYLGDHDPSGMHMTTDIEDRLDMYTREAVPLTVHRIALNMDQVEAWRPPKNPAKKKDSRFAAYAKKYGKSSWELDAVEPNTLARLVRETVTGLIDADVWQRVAEEEAQMRAELLNFVESYRKGKGNE